MKDEISHQVRDGVTGMRKGCLIVLIAYILTIYFFAVLGRSPSVNSYIRLELFRGYSHKART